MVIIFATDKQKYFIYEFGNLVKNVKVLLFLPLILFQKCSR